ncbi:MAG: hypothetical protein MZW92_05975 [Comamonadaceae bacterium]|nr:hypothetical protein [Comamonadaceae bacterium]
MTNSIADIEEADVHPDHRLQHDGKPPGHLDRRQARRAPERASQAHRGRPAAHRP